MTDKTTLTTDQVKEIEDKAIASGEVTKEEIDKAELAQEGETDRMRQHVFEYQRYNDLAQVVRHLLGAMTQLTRYKDTRRVNYWADVTNRWKNAVTQILENKELFEPPLTKQLIEELSTNIERLKKLKPGDLKDIRVLVDDIQYRLGAVYGSLVSLDGIKQYAIEKRHSDLVEYIQGRIDLLSERIKTPTALDTEESLKIDERVLLELRGLIYHDNQSNNNNNERSK